jgi:hypothetical protein
MNFLGWVLIYRGIKAIANIYNDKIFTMSLRACGILCGLLLFYSFVLQGGYVGDYSQIVLGLLLTFSLYALIIRLLIKTMLKIDRPYWAIILLFAMIIEVVKLSLIGIGMLDMPSGFWFLATYQDRFYINEMIRTILLVFGFWLAFRRHFVRKKLRYSGSPQRPQ